MYFLLILEGRKGRERKSNVREKCQSAVTSMLPNRGQNPQPRHVPRWGIEPATLWFTGWRSKTHQPGLTLCISERFQILQLCSKYKSCRDRPKETEGSRWPFCSHCNNVSKTGVTKQTQTGENTETLNATWHPHYGLRPHPRWSVEWASFEFASPQLLFAALPEPLNVAILPTLLDWCTAKTIQDPHKRKRQRSDVRTLCASLEKQQHFPLIIMTADSMRKIGKMKYKL